jgi:hypothetical protein
VDHSEPHRLFTDPPIAAVLGIEIFDDAAFRQAYEFGERRVRPARSARQCRGKGRHGRAAVPIERPQIDVAGGAAGGAARPQEPIAGCDGRADCRREQHRHPLGLALVPHGDQVLGILEDLSLSRATRSRFLLRSLPAAVLHFALVESHNRIVAELALVSISALPPGADAHRGSQDIR